MNIIYKLTPLVLAALILLISGCKNGFGYYPDGSRLARVYKSPNYDGEKFKNKDSTRSGLKKGSLNKTMNRFIFGKQKRAPENVFPVKFLEPEDLKHNADSPLRAVKIGHSSFLLDIEGSYILTDPVWSERVSPVSFAGPSRFHSVPVELKDLPDLAAVLISHDHYDHLDMATVLELAEKNVHFYMPLGVGAHFEEWGIPDSQFTEMDWGDSVLISKGSIKLVLTPARHFSGRSVFRRNNTLWGSWTIIGQSHRVFFSGDTGYMTDFKKIGAQYGPFDITMLDMGAYGPSWPDIHMTPEEAVAAHRDLRGKVLLPVHWGTFSLNIADWDEPVSRLIEAAQKDSVQFVIPYPGQIVSFNELPELEIWWYKYNKNQNMR